MKNNYLTVLNFKKSKIVRFPYILKKTDNFTGKRCRMSLDLLNESNLPFFNISVKKWESFVASRNIPDLGPIYYDNLRITHPEWIMRTSEKPFPLKAEKRTFHIILSSENTVEGIAALSIYKTEVFSTMNFIGLAPWNLANKGFSPKFSGLSYELTAFSMAICLQAAENLDDDAQIFNALFSSKRGTTFAKRFFGFEGNITKESLNVDVNKRGVKAFLDGDLAVFRDNCSFQIFHINNVHC